MIVEITIAVYSNRHDDNNNIFTNESRESFQSHSGRNVLEIFFFFTFYLNKLAMNDNLGENEFYLKKL